MLRVLHAALLSLLSAASALADTQTFTAVKDATIYSESVNKANGGGQTIQVGRTGSGGGSNSRRGLIQFNTSSIPAGSVITSVTLTLRVEQTGGVSQAITLHRLTQDWNEGPSTAPPTGGLGAAAQATDVTWQYRVHNTASWTTFGGTFVAAASASTNTTAANTTYTWSGSGLVADVQGWLDGSFGNHGWLLKGNESTDNTAKNISSRTNATVANRPVLTVVFTPPTNVGRCCFPNGTCSVISSTNCSNGGGTYAGNGTNCNPNVCQQPTGACCFGDGSCNSALTAASCASQGGIYQGNGVLCTTNLCPVLSGACCLPNATCAVMTQANCTNAGGIYHGNSTSCNNVSCNWILTPFVDELPIPSVAVPTSGTAGSFAHYDIYIRQISHQFHRDLPPTIAWGYNSMYPGPTIEARSYRTVTVQWHNDLRTGHFGNILRTDHVLPVDTCAHGPDVTGVVPVTVTHLHGAHLKPDSDGYPDASFPPGQSSAIYTYPNVQPAATMWYHDHATGLTRLNVYMGLAGFYLLRDDAEAALGLPSGQYEVPLVIQDRSFDSVGRLRYTNGFQDHFFGEFTCVNGKVWPYMNVKQGKYRFRIVNGSSDRTYKLNLPTINVFSINFPQSFLIGTDLGLRSSPLAVETITLMPGERADLIIDFSNYSIGSHITITNSALSPFPAGGDGPNVFNVMKFIVTQPFGHQGALPNALVPVPIMQPSQASTHRAFQLQKFLDNHCNRDIWLINGMNWDDIVDYPLIGSTEIWSFINRSGVSHPMHMHLVAFQVLDRQAFTVSGGGQIIPTGPLYGPDPTEMGWKDTVQATPNQITRVIATFDDYPGRFPFHCHILDHEDHEMMRQFEVRCRNPRVIGDPTDVVVTPGRPILLGAAFEGDLLSFSWMREDAPLPLFDGEQPDGSVVFGVTTPSLRIMHGNVGTTGIYRARAVDPCGNSLVTAPARVFVRVCIADMDDGSGLGYPDGGTSIEDLLYYLGAFDAGSIRADVDDGGGTGEPDGGITIEDLLYYLSRFDSGC